MTELEATVPGKVAPVVRKNAALAEAPAHGECVTQLAAKSIGAEAYRNVAGWLLDRLG